MSEALDTVSNCCRAEIDTRNPSDPYFICLKCGALCQPIRPDRTPAPFDPSREKWTRKPAGIAVANPPLDLSGFKTPGDPLEPR